MSRWLFLLAFVGCDTDKTKAVLEGDPNRVPSVPVIELVPEVATTVDDLQVRIVTESEDLDGDEVEYKVIWAVDGEEREELDGMALSNIFTERGQVWTVKVTATDGIADASSVSAEATVENSLPEVESLVVDPDEIFEKSEVRCELGVVSDADNDPVSLDVVWVVNDEELDVEGPLTGDHFDKGDEILCRAFVDDGVETMDPIDTDTFIVQNTPPSLIGCLLTNNDPGPTDTVGVTPDGWWDDDGDPEGYFYEWFVGGPGVPHEPVSTSAVLEPDLFFPGANIYVEITPWDGSDEGTTRTSDYATGAY